ncbi:hypothetical protein LOK49_LG02G00454 [Camellia lanceoleosa]|uniref:Uncharacterized protein n=1 Tax=Camellia lanceoleosa TaxID=1840588 RepID=A0ACC0IQL1_9ERIC|nr:hypothetical protein LOK49_LG02G00454 [Camellia lanceoleosa]
MSRERNRRNGRTAFSFLHVKLLRKKQIPVLSVKRETEEMAEHNILDVKLFRKKSVPCLLFSVVVSHSVLLFDTTLKFYHNIATGQKFKTKEELVRYANYCKRVASSYYDDFKECYRNSKGVYVERPWETDPYNTFSDYVEGRVGKVKDKLAGNSSSISTSSSVITSDGKMLEMLPKKSEAKAKKK